MEDDDRERLRVCHDVIYDDVDPNLIVGHLFSKNFLSENDKEEIEAGKTKRIRLKSLILILERKQPIRSQTAYSVFVEALKREQYDHVVESLNNVVPTVQIKRKNKVDPTECSDEVRRVLTKYYTTTGISGIEESLFDVQQKLSKEVKVKGGFAWKRDELKNFVCETFGVEAYVKSGSKRHPVFFKNLIEKSKQPTVPAQQDQKERPEGAVGGTSDGNNGIQTGQKDVCNMDPDELRDCLTELFEKKKITSSLPCLIAHKGICGETLLSWTKSDVEDIAPEDEKFGAIKCLVQFIESKKSKEKPPIQETYEKLRPFWTKVDHIVKYKEHFLVDAAEGGIGLKLNPVRCFYGVSEDLQKEESMAFAVVRFASACINERQNGTIYFGIQPSDNNSNKGTIYGVRENKDTFEDYLQEFMKGCFEDSFVPFIQKVVSGPWFVEVVGRKNTFVIEVDVAPSQQYLSSVTDLVMTKGKKLKVSSRKSSRRDACFLLTEKGFPELVDQSMVKDYQKNLMKNIEKRTQEEDKVHTTNRVSGNLRKQLLNHLTGGRETLEDMVYPLLILSPLDFESFNQEHFQFIKHLRPEAVFDFEPLGASQGIYHTMDVVHNQAMQVLTLNNFSNMPAKNASLTNSLRTGDKIPWIFGNGHKATKMEQLGPLEWNRKQRSAFRDCVKLLSSIVEKKRTIIMIFLLSKNYDTMIEGCEEILTEYPDQWVVFAESENLAEQWKQSMLTRAKVSKKDIQNHCIVGLPLDQLNIEIMHLRDYKDIQMCLLPRSNGTRAKVREKKIKDWSSLDVLSAADPVIQDSNSESYRKKIEANYHSGGPIDWLNFYYQDQVLKRSFHNNLKETVEEALRNPEEEETVTSVFLCHQPGAGGTTSAKQILWDLRKKYRCCVVQNITDDTCEQLKELRMYDDGNPSSLLILLDESDEEKCNKLRYDLEEEGRRIQRQSDHDDISSIYCTLLICIRRSSLPHSIPFRWKNVPHKLKDDEIAWFKNKEKLFEENDIDPKYLLSFNILKTNFNPDYIESVVKEFVDDISQDSELELLTELAFLNNYDFRSVPVSCFDHLFTGQSSLPDGQRSLNWEAHLSQPMLVLLNLSHPTGNKMTANGQTVRLINGRIAHSLLEHLKKCTRKKESEIMFQLIESPVFDIETRDAKALKDIIANIMKTREVNKKGQKAFFSRFITNIKEREGDRVAVQLMTELYQKNQDPFTAQQLSRYYITMKEWKEAEHYACSAVMALPENPFLWDTFGQVFKYQLYDIIDFGKRNVGRNGLDEEKIKKCIQLTKNAVEYFKKEQSLVEKHIDREFNLAGYLGELKSLIMLLGVLATCKFFKDRSELRAFLINPGYYMASLTFLTQAEVDFLKQLEQKYKETMRRVDEEYLQVKRTVNFRIRASTIDSHTDKSVLFSLMISFSDYFLEDISEERLPREERLLFRYTKALKLGASSLHRLLHLRQGGEENLFEIYKLMFSIVAEAEEFDYLQAILNVVSVLIVDGHIPRGITFNSVLTWCSKLYKLNQSLDTSQPYLEPYLYFMMYNFCTVERQKYHICSINELKEAQWQWHLAFRKKYTEKETQWQRERTLFFLGNGNFGTDLVHQDSLSELDKEPNRKEKWHQPAVREKLRLLEGTLENGGEKITMFIESGDSMFRLVIPIAYKVKNKSLWQETVYFFLGFSFAGPKAFAVSKEPIPAEAAQHQTYQQNPPMSFSQRQQPKLILQSLSSLIDKKHRILRKLTDKERQKERGNTQRKQDLVQEISKLRQELSDVEASIKLLLR